MHLLKGAFVMLYPSNNYLFILQNAEDMTFSVADKGLAGRF